MLQGISRGNTYREPTGFELAISTTQFDIGREREASDLSLGALPGVDVALLNVRAHQAIEPDFELRVRIGDATSSNALPESIRKNWQRLGTSGLSLGLFRRLKALAQKPDGWRGAGSRALSASSLRQFLDFWRAVRNQPTEPFLTVAPNGHLYAEWHASWKRHLDLEFTGGDTIFFGLFHGHRTYEGCDSPQELASFLLGRKTNPLNWHM
jgi:hypothetical protein